ncbi:MAG: type IV pilus modification PilV family protein [Actinomycetota bacterium]
MRWRGIRRAVIARVRRDQSGMSLLEVQIGIILIGLVMTAMMSSLATATMTSDIQRRQAVAGTELKRYVEYVRAVPYMPCVEPDTDLVDSQYTFKTLSALPGIDVGVTGRVVQVQFLQLDAVTTADKFDRVPVDRAAAGCPIKDTGVQQLTISITAGGSPAVTREATVVKRESAS